MDCEQQCAAVCGSAHESSVRAVCVAVCVSALGRVRQCTRQCAALAVCGSVRQYTTATLRVKCDKDYVQCVQNKYGQARRKHSINNPQGRGPK